MDLKNPWTEIPDQPDFVLPQDEALVRLYNSRLTATDHRRINLRHTPEPRLGPIDAPVYTLQANPSYDRKHANGDPDPSRVVQELGSIRNEAAPHLGLMRKNRWWDATFAKLLRDGVGREKAAASVCSVEYSPYRSLRFGHADLELPSRSYTIALVQRAIRQGKLIIITRRVRSWCNAIPELVDHLGRTTFRGSNPRRIFLTPGNLTPEVYDRVCDAIRRSP